MASGCQELTDLGPASPKRIRLEDSADQCKTNAETRLRSYNLSEDTVDSTLTGSEDTFILEPVFNNFDQIDNQQNEQPSCGEEGDEDDTSSTLSSVSDLSGLSEVSGHQWKPMANILGTIGWIEKQMLKGVSPRVVLTQITGDSSPLPETVSDIAIWKVIFAYLTEYPRRSRLSNVKTLEDAVSLLKTCTKIIVLTGAGVSVSCGIPDFRSKDGVYARLAVDFPDLPDPQSMFDINYFRRDPRPFFKFAREIYPGQFKPSPCHRFIKMLEKQRKLLRNYTQNIDTLERVAGIENVMECHGSFSTASCTRCGHKVSSDSIREEVMKQQIPLCPVCPSQQTEGERSVMKPDIVFFGEGLPESFHDSMGRDRDECDLLIVIGSSLKVKPVALIPCSLPRSVPQVLINRERLPHMKFDVELLGDSDIIIDHLCHMMGGEWEQICWKEAPLIDGGPLFPPSDSSSENNFSEDSESSGGWRRGRGDPPRHLSLDSSRDSGISDSPLTLPLPKDSYFKMSKRRYAFPGAELAGYFGREAGPSGD